MARATDQAATQSSSDALDEKLTRRELVAGAVGAGLLLAACGSDGNAEPAPAPPDAAPSPPMLAPTLGDQSPDRL